MTFARGSAILFMSQPRHCIFRVKYVPFYKWVIDIVSSLPLAIGQRKFILVATNYFTKWVEVEAYAQIKAI